MPADLHRVLTARLAALPAGARDVLLVAACLRSPTTTMLEQAGGPAAPVPDPKLSARTSACCGH